MSEHSHLIDAGGVIGGEGGEGGDEGAKMQSALAATESTPTVTTAFNSLLIVHTWMATAAPVISYASPSPSVVHSSDGTPKGALVRW